MRALSLFWGFALLLHGARAQGSVVEEPALITRPTLGAGVQIGALYDARTEQMTGFFLWPRNIIQSHLVQTPVRKSQFDFSYDDTLSTKLELLAISGSFKIEVLGASKVNVDGHASYLNDMRKTRNAARMSVTYKLRTVEESLDAFHEEMRDSIYMDITQRKLATHVVTSVSWGTDCIALFEKEYDSAFDKLDIEASLSIAVETTMVKVTAKAAGVYNASDVAVSDGIRLRLYGNMIPPADEGLPISVLEGLDFMRRLHAFGLAGNGVPMQMTLTPLKWLESSADAVIYAVSEATIQEAVRVFQEFADSEQYIRDLTLVDSKGFLAWQWDVSSYLDDFLGYNLAFSGNLTLALRAYRANGTINELALLLASYQESEWTVSEVIRAVEKKHDNIMNLVAEVAAMQRSDVKVEMAEHFYQLTAPSLDRKYNKVYALVLTGIQPDHDRLRVETIGRFLNLARSRRRQGTYTGDIDHCLEVTTANGKTECVETMKFVVIHFNSFCPNFCDPKYCQPNPDPCPPGSGTGDNTFPQECWCAAPLTTAVVFDNSAAGVIADLPIIPPIPVLMSVTGDRGAGSVEPSPYSQKVKVTVRKPIDEVNVLNYRVRVIWFIAKISSNGDLSWARQQRTFDTRNKDNTIMVPDLIAGESYRFSVAAMTDVGMSAFSSEWPESMVTVSSNTVTLYRTSDMSTPLTEVPNWGSAALTVEVSKELLDPIGRIVFYAAEIQMECVIIGGQATGKRANCILQANTYATDSMTARVLVYSLSDDQTPQGFSARTVTDINLVAPSQSACQAWPGSGGLFCNMKNQLDYTGCVSSCSSCSFTYKTTILSTTQVNGICQLPSDSSAQQECVKLVDAASYNGDSESATGYPVLRNGQFFKIQAVWRSGGISQREWSYRSSTGWRQVYCTSANGWALYAANCDEVVPAVFGLKVRSASAGEVPLVTQSSPTVFPPECTVPVNPTDDLFCRLSRPVVLQVGDMVIPRLVGPAYVGTVVFDLWGCGLIG